MKLRFVLPAIAFFLTPLLHAEDTRVEILTGAAGMQPGWVYAGWAGVDPKVVDGQGRNPDEKAVRLNLGSETTDAWAGVRFLPSWDKKKGIPITPELVEGGYIEGYLTTPEDVRASNIQLQVRMDFGAKDGATVVYKRAGSSFLPIDRYLEKRRVDSDPKTWQRFQIPVKEWLGELKDRGAAGTLDGLAIQFVQNPQAELLVTDVAIVTPEKKP